MKRIFASLPVLLLPIITLAHPNHGDTDGFTIIHYIAEPIHVVSLVLVGLAVIVLTREFKHQKAS